MSEGSFISFGVEGVPYSQVRVDLPFEDGEDGASLDGDRIVEAVRLAKVLADAYAETFYQGRPEREEPHYEPFQGDPPSTSVQSRGGPPSASGGNVAFYCPEHNAEVKPSVRNKTMEFDPDLGYEIHASWFHTLPDGKSHSVWRSRLVKRELATR